MRLASAAFLRESGTHISCWCAWCVCLPQAAGFMYSKEEMLQIYKDGHFKSTEFAEQFQQVPNATTPEFLIPLALLPIPKEEAELRLNPVVVGNPQGPGGRGREGGKGFDREGKGKGKGKGEREGKGKGERDGWGRNERDSAGGRWEERGGRNTTERYSNGERMSDTPLDTLPPPAAAAPRAPLAKPAPPKDWFYRDLHGTVQGARRYHNPMSIVAVRYALAGCCRHGLIHHAPESRARNSPSLSAELSLSLTTPLRPCRCRRSVFGGADLRVVHGGLPSCGAPDAPCRCERAPSCLSLMPIPHAPSHMRFALVLPPACVS